MYLNMKKLYFTVLVLTVFVLFSCKNKVNLYTDEGEHTVVYAMLDSNADTNYFKITKSFVGNVNQYGHDYDANNYNYKDLEVRFSGVFDDDTQVQTVLLDTISIFVPYDENSTFYSGCYQTYYYTTKKLKEGKEYTLNIFRKTDSVNISAKAKTINSFAFKNPLETMGDITFTEMTTSTSTVEWKVREKPYTSTASYFEVVGYFNYKEQMPGASEIVHHSIKWSLGSGKAEDLINTSTNIPYYLVTYTPSSLFTILANDKHLVEDSPIGVQRWFEKFEFKVSAIGEDLYNYYLATNSTSAIQDVPNYTNIENGMGIMSARNTKTLSLDISEKTRVDIDNRFKQYGFSGDIHR